jgi:SAM-dependent methyltransferase
MPTKQQINLSTVNWSKIWEDGVLFFIGQAEKSQTWNNTAASWDKLSSQDAEYRDQVINRMCVKKDWTVLDAGCGTGLLALPLAKKVKKVIGLDASENMLKFLKINMDREKIKNIDIVHKKLEEAVIGKDIEQCDVVIASRSMGHEHYLQNFLAAMNNAANRYAYLTWGASDRYFDITLHKAIGREYGDTRTYIIIYNLLYQMGIRANIEIFTCASRGMEYASADAAVEQYRKRFKNMSMKRELTTEEETKLKIFFNKNLSKTKDGTYIFDAPNTNKQALIWWEKETNIPLK